MCGHSPNDVRRHCQAQPAAQVHAARPAHQVDVVAGANPVPRDLDEPDLAAGHPALGVHNAVRDQEDPHHSGSQDFPPSPCNPSRIHVRSIRQTHIR